jgi:alpha-N-acetylglucosaminidase
MNMTRRAVVAGAAAAALGALTPLPALAAPKDGFAPALRALARRRLGPSLAAQVQFTLSKTDGQPGTDVPELFSIGGRTGHIMINATSPSAATEGLGWYLKYVALLDSNLGSGSARGLPKRLPGPGKEIIRSATKAHRFIQNDTVDGYTQPYADFAMWEEWIDSWALHGLNEVFLSVGTDAVYYQLFQEFGYSRADLRSWIPQPAHQPWWLLQNLSGNDTPLTERQLADRARLGKRIVSRFIELGIRPVLPGYYGTVPGDFAQRNPGSNVVPQGTWCYAYQRPDWLDPNDPLFAKIAARFYALSGQLLGPAAMFKMDPMHEGGEAGNVDLPKAATAIDTALTAAHPAAIWVALGWQGNPSAPVLAGLPDPQRMLIVDGLSDRYGDWSAGRNWGAVPATFGAVYNFGGHTSIGANTGVWLDRYYNSTGPSSDFDGVSLLPESWTSNPYAGELLTELPWHEAAFDHAAWTRVYARARYGTDAAAAAWEIIRRTAYSMPAGDWDEPADSVFGAAPDLQAGSAAAWSPPAQRYDMADFEKSLPLLLAAAGSVRNTAAYRFDLVDVTRQVLDNRGRTLLPSLAAAYAGKDATEFRRLADDFLHLIDRVDEITGCHADFMLGTALQRAEQTARQWGTDPVVAAQDLKRSYTTWGPRDASVSGGLRDYANREWNGLVGTYYRPRWAAYFTALETALRTGSDPEPIDWFARGDAWVRGEQSIARRASGDPVEVARRVVAKLQLD